MMRLKIKKNFGKLASWMLSASILFSQVPITTVSAMENEFSDETVIEEVIDTVSDEETIESIEDNEEIIGVSEEPEEDIEESSEGIEENSEEDGSEEDISADTEEIIDGNPAEEEEAQEDEGIAAEELQYRSIHLIDKSNRNYPVNPLLLTTLECIEGQNTYVEAEETPVGNMVFLNRMVQSKQAIKNVQIYYLDEENNRIDVTFENLGGYYSEYLASILSGRNGNTMKNQGLSNEFASFVMPDKDVFIEYETEPIQGKITIKNGYTDHVQISDTPGLNSFKVSSGLEDYEDVKVYLDVEEGYILDKVNVTFIKYEYFSDDVETDYYGVVIPSRISHSNSDAFSEKVEWTSYNIGHNSGNIRMISLSEIPEYSDLLSSTNGFQGYDEIILTPYVQEPVTYHLEIRYDFYDEARDVIGGYDYFTELSASKYSSKYPKSRCYDFMADTDNHFHLSRQHFWDYGYSLDNVTVPSGSGIILYYKDVSAGSPYLAAHTDTKYPISGAYIFAKEDYENYIAGNGFLPYYETTSNERLPERVGLIDIGGYQLEAIGSKDIVIVPVFDAYIDVSFTGAEIDKNYSGYFNNNGAWEQVEHCIGCWYPNFSVTVSEIEKRPHPQYPQYLMDFRKFLYKGEYSILSYSKVEERIVKRSYMDPVTELCVSYEKEKNLTGNDIWYSLSNVYDHPGRRFLASNETIIENGMNTVMVKSAYLKLGRGYDNLICQGLSDALAATAKSHGLMPIAIRSDKDDSIYTSSKAYYTAESPEELINRFSDMAAKFRNGHSNFAIGEEALTLSNSISSLETGNTIPVIRVMEDCSLNMVYAPYQYTLLPISEHGTITFTIGGKDLNNDGYDDVSTTAQMGDTVSIKVNPYEGWKVKSIHCYFAKDEYDNEPLTVDKISDRTIQEISTITDGSTITSVSFGLGCDDLVVAVEYERIGSYVVAIPAVLEMEVVNGQLVSVADITVIHELPKDDSTITVSILNNIILSDGYCNLPVNVDKSSFMVDKNSSAVNISEWNKSTEEQFILTANPVPGNWSGVMTVNVSADF